jgi:hypothetical protein
MTAGKIVRRLLRRHVAAEAFVSVHCLPATILPLHDAEFPGARACPSVPIATLATACTMTVSSTSIAFSSSPAARRPLACDLSGPLFIPDGAAARPLPHVGTVRLAARGVTANSKGVFA